MSEVTEQQILEALNAVTDPETGSDVVTQGMVSGLQVKDGHVAFALEVDPERGPTLESLRKEAEKTVHALPGVLSATVVLTAERSSQPAPGPGSQPAPGPGGQPAPGPGGQPASGPDQSLMPGVQSIVAVASGKGGVGKSTTSVNLALALAAGGHSVGLLDADIYGPSLPRMMGITGQPTSSDGHRLDPMENYGIKCMSMGFLVEEDTPVIWRGPMAQSALLQMMRDVNWGNLDIMIVDLPPGTGDVQLTIAQQVPLAGAIIVSTPQDIALLDARKGLNMFRKVDVPVYGIIENMSYFLCPHCNERTEIFSHGGAHRVAETLGTAFLGEIPLATDIRETSDSGRPIVVSDPGNEHAKVYLAIAERIWEKTGEVAVQAPKIVVQ